MLNKSSNPLASLLMAVMLTVSASIQAQTASGNDNANVTIGDPPEAVKLDAERDKLCTAGRYAEAIPIARRALALREKALGSENATVGRSLAELGIILAEDGDYDEADSLIRRALPILERALGPDNAEVAQVLSAQGTVVQARGDYIAAESILRRALVIAEKASGPESSETAGVLSDLGGLLFAKGDYPGAEALARRALAIQEKLLGPDSVVVAQLLNNLARLVKYKRDLKGAEEMMRRALSIKEKALGPDHPDVAVSLMSLGTLYRQQLNFADAESMYKRALTILERAHGRTHFRLASILLDLAALRSSRRDFAGAQSLYGRALSIKEKALGPDHPSVGDTLDSLARVLEARGEFAREEPLLERALDIEDKSALRILQSGSLRQKQAFFATLDSSTRHAVSFHVHQRPRETSALRLALRTILRRKGLAAEAGAWGIRQVAEHASAPDRERLEALATLRAELANRTLNGPVTDSSATSHRAALARLQSDVERLERELSERYLELRVGAKLADIDTIVSALPPASALVEFVVYTPYNAKAKLDYRLGPPRYAAYILANRAEPSFVDLGEASSIDEIVAEYRKTLVERRTDFPDVARQLDDRVMRPVRDRLGGISDVYLAPDGALNLVPFASLIDETGQYLVERYRFNVLTTGRDLLRFRQRLTPRSPSLVMGGPSYGNEVTDNTPDTSRGVRSFDFRQVHFSPLPEAREESRQIADIVPNATLLTDERATEGALKKARAPRILHVATHGFFLEDLDPTDTHGQRGFDLVSTGPDNSGDSAIALPEDPMLRAGLAFAGANPRQSGDDDGILTALEASGLDLWGTQLVVLSACDTGIGQVNNGDGIYGLRRALSVSGSETQIMSLWKVDDQATRHLMSDYYRRLFRGGGRIDALRQAQLAMLKNPATQHPYYWAAFIAAGDGRTLDYGDAPSMPDSGLGVSTAPRSGGCHCSLGKSKGGDGSGDLLVVIGILALAYDWRKRARRRLDSADRAPYLQADGARRHRNRSEQR